MPTSTRTATKPGLSKKAVQLIAPNAVELLKSDHKEVKALFRAYEKLVKSAAGNEEKQTLAEQICTMVTVHAIVEEEIFYPAVRSAVAEQDLLDEAEVEHASAKDLITQIQSMTPSDNFYDAKVKVLGEYIDHHVEEEESEMFPESRESDLDLKALGAQLAKRKAELMAQAGKKR